MAKLGRPKKQNTEEETEVLIKEKIVKLPKKLSIKDLKEQVIEELNGTEEKK